MSPNGSDFGIKIIFNLQTELLRLVTHQWKVLFVKPRAPHTAISPHTPSHLFGLGLGLIRWPRFLGLDFNFGPRLLGLTSSSSSSSFIFLFFRWIRIFIKTIAQKQNNSSIQYPLQRLKNNLLKQQKLRKITKIKKYSLYANIIQAYQ